VQDFSDSRIVKYLLGWTLYYQGERQRAETLLETMIDDEDPLPSNARATLAAFRAARHLKPARWAHRVADVTSGGLWFRFSTSHTAQSAARQARCSAQTV
jgi:hypothetical protein